MASNRTLIFLVDDDDMYLKTAVHTLSQNRSFDIKQFTSGEAAIKAAKSGKKVVMASPSGRSQGKW